MEELKQLQKEDLARRRQTVAQMPPQLVELPYRRSEVKEDWQRELEFAFEDMYSADRSKGLSGALAVLFNVPWEVICSSEQCSFCDGLLCKRGLKIFIVKFLFFLAIFSHTRRKTCLCVSLLRGERKPDFAS